MHVKVLVSVLVTIFMAIGEYIFTINKSLGLSFFDYIETYLLVSIFLIVSIFSKNRFFSVLVATLIILGTGINIVFNQYFGRYLMPYDIAMFFNEVEDTSSGLLSGFNIFAKPLFWYLILYAIFVYFIFYKHNKEGKSKFIFLGLTIIFLVLSFIPVINGKKFEVNLHYSVVRNSISVYTAYIGSLFKDKEKNANKIYLPYKITKNNEKVNVIFIMGESSNFRHSSLYGYHRNTTPYLTSLKNQENFKFYRGVSRGFSTRIGVPLTLNVIQEPDNSAQLLSLKTNLFQLAKNNGFNTFYLSNQKSGVLASLINARAVDEFHDVNSTKIPNNTTTDMRLIEFLSRSLSGKTDQPFFAVLHQRNHHFAYDENYPNEYDIYKNSTDKFQRLIDTYDNSFHFQDNFMKGLFSTVSNLTKKPTLIVYTSDHGELFGKDGLWGHGAPIIHTAGVPIFIYALNGADKLLNQSGLPEECAISNYHLGKFVAKSIGWDVYNPNETKDFYVNISLPYDDAEGFKKFPYKEVLHALC